MQFDLAQIHILPRKIFESGIALPAASQISSFGAFVTSRRRKQTSLWKPLGGFTPSSDLGDSQAEPHKAIKDNKSPRDQSEGEAS